ncbi:MFS transporter [Streptomyces sp. Cmuel-A718b]|uniref:MFS transporter n=1 Tax=unclassified Streptomyces TaxID=2593676 RepID=UPI00081DB532|nr:MFS transporter [Streptomyces sp. Cmuel-A718b]SCF66054.1 Transmembrane secretion effector [Streptomyces sp. Cmuel-A718b]
MTQEGPAIPGRRSLRPLAGVLAAIAASVTGTRISLIALPWFVLVTTGSATRTGLVAFCEMAPYVLVKALSGPLVDRTGPRTVSWTTDLASAAAAAAIPVLHTLDQLSFPVLLGLVALIGAARGPGDLAKEVMVPEAAERAGTSLERAMGLSGVIERLASTVGPAAGGALVALLGPMTGLVVNAGCFVLGSVIVAVALPRGTGRPVVDSSAPADAQEPGYWRRFGEGFTFLRGDPLLLAVIVVVGITNLLDAALTTLMVPVWAEESGNGPAAIGLTSTAMGAAAVGGSLIAAMAAHRLPRRAVFLIGFLLGGAPRFLVLALDAPLGVVLAVFAVSGFGAGFINPVLGAVLVERVPRRMLGRVNALGDSLSWSGIPLGGLLAGAAVTAVGLTPVLLVCGAAYFLTTTLAGLRPGWRAMDRPRENGAQREEAARDGARTVS